MIGKILNNTYRIEERLSAGGMGQVYIAAHQRIEGRCYAIKQLLPEFSDSEQFSQRFISEAKAMMALNHPNIVRIEDFLIEDGTYFLIMEFVEGESCAEKIRREAPLPPEEIHNYLFQLLDALDYCHRKGIIHRDLKPANILIDKENRLKLTDFGIARQSNAPKLTQTGTILGTPEYMSPEQILANRPIDQRSDLYSVGVIFYEMLSGSVPFPASKETQSTYNVLFAHVNNEPPPISDSTVPRYLLDALFKSLAKNPDDRFQSAAEFKQFLEQHRFSASSSSSTPEGTAEFRRSQAIQAPPVSSSFPSSSSTPEGTAEFRRSQAIQASPSFSSVSKEASQESSSSALQESAPLETPPQSRGKFFVSFLFVIALLLVSFTAVVLFLKNSSSKNSKELHTITESSENKTLSVQAQRSKEENRQLRQAQRSKEENRQLRQAQRSKEENRQLGQAQSSQEENRQLGQVQRSKEKKHQIRQSPSRWPQKVNPYCQTMLDACFSQCLKLRPTSDPLPKQYCHKACWKKRFKDPFRTLCQP